MASEIVEHVRDKVSIFDAAELLGLDSSDLRKCPCHAPYRPDKTPSFSVYDNGRRYNDFADPDCKGDVIAFWALIQGIDYKEALKELLKASGLWGAQSRPAYGYRPKAVAAGSRISRNLPTTKECKTAYKASQSAQEWFSEGQYSLYHDEAKLRHIANWRGWPIGFIKAITQEGWLSCPSFHRDRVLAFPVQMPMESPLGFSTEIVGYHILKNPLAEDKKLRQWNYTSGDFANRITPPALPLVLGNFDSCKRLIILEGQWDALSLAYALGFFEHDTAWDSNCCIVGIRGAASWQSLIKHYRPFWPQKCECFLIPDNDEAGKSWTEYKHGTPSFFTELEKLCLTVKPFRFRGSKDFNDWLKANPHNLKSLKTIFP